MNLYAVTAQLKKDGEFTVCVKEVKGKPEPKWQETEEGFQTTDIYETQFEAEKAAELLKIPTVEFVCPEDY